MATKAAVKAVFSEWDANGDGQISLPELRDVLEKLGLPRHSTRTVFVEADLNHDGNISYDEFLSWVYSPSGAKASLPSDVFASLFSKDVKELGQKLVSNVSNISGNSSAPQLWRTQTGGHSFALPPGVKEGQPPSLLAYQVMQFLSQRTDDSSSISPGILPAMLPHRPMFKKILDACGEIVAVHSKPTGTGSAQVDLFLLNDSLFRLRIDDVKFETADSKPVCSGMNGFQPSPIQPSEVPPELWQQVQPAGSAGKQAVSMPVERLGASRSLLATEELQQGDLVVTSEPIAKHTMRVSVRLADHCTRLPRYVLLVPRLNTTLTGHARYADHQVSIAVDGETLADAKQYQSFVVANIAGRKVDKLVVTHTFTNCQVRLQTKDTATNAQILTPATLSEEERAANLSCEFSGKEKVKALLVKNGLARRAGERDIAYAVRVGQALCNGYQADAAIVDRFIDELPTLIWERGAGDCSAFNLGFVHALRIFDIPARVSLGFKYGKAVQQAIGTLAATHCTAEFYAEGIGWVPCDATLGLRRLGHEAGANLSFIEWRAAQETPEERKEFAQVGTPKFQSLEPGSYRGLGYDADGEPYWGSQAGLKLYEGGPFAGEPLPPSKMRECFAVMADMDKVMSAAGAGGSSEWSRLWPTQGVFLCSYDLEESPAA
eukprot:TRINITY_DN57934_c0_g1_i1.p1 TRINITY_DN57934_c0_g1~~TRINITY_DN57934_c0_g1_i1.p1  ORF type:complete len:661 (-),score=94.05 TRINITY_DN57934_c0_g1_i1:8-1990(-)